MNIKLKEKIKKIKVIYFLLLLIIIDLNSISNKNKIIFGAVFSGLTLIGLKINSDYKKLNIFYKDYISNNIKDKYELLSNNKSFKNILNSIDRNKEYYNSKNLLNLFVKYFFDIKNKGNKFLEKISKSENEFKFLEKIKNSENKNDLINLFSNEEYKDIKLESKEIDLILNENKNKNYEKGNSVKLLNEIKYGSSNENLINLYLNQKDINIDDIKKINKEIVIPLKVEFLEEIKNSENKNDLINLFSNEKYKDIKLESEEIDLILKKNENYEKNFLFKLLNEIKYRSSDENLIELFSINQKCNKYLVDIEDIKEINKEIVIPLEIEFLEKIKNSEMNVDHLIKLFFDEKYKDIKLNNLGLPFIKNIEDLRMKNRYGFLVKFLNDVRILNQNTIIGSIFQVLAEHETFDLKNIVESIKNFDEKKGLYAEFLYFICKYNRKELVKLLFDKKYKDIKLDGLIYNHSISKGNRISFLNWLRNKELEFESLFDKDVKFNIEKFKELNITVDEIINKIKEFDLLSAEENKLIKFFFKKEDIKKYLIII